MNINNCDWIGWQSIIIYIFIDHKRPTGHLLDEKWFYATNRIEDK